MCWFHMIQKCRNHRNLLTKQQWIETDKDIHAMQLSFSEDVFNQAINLLLAKWRMDPSFAKFYDYFNEQWIRKLPLW